MPRVPSRFFTLTEIAERFGGEVVGEARVSRVASLAGAGGDAIAFLANSKYRAQLADTRAGAVILGGAAREATALPRIVAENPYAADHSLSAQYEHTVLVTEEGYEVLTVSPGMPAAPG